MSGHSKWHSIRHQKAANDAKRGKIFTKMANIITIAAREKGGDLDTNFSLRLAVDRAKASNMPKDNIDRAIKKGTGELEGGQIDELIYEGIGPVNAQFVVKCLTDNKNRTASEIRHIFSKSGGSLGSVMWNFDKKSVIRIIGEEVKEKNLASDDMELELIDAGAEDIENVEEGMIIYAEMGDLKKIKDFLETKEIKVESADLEYVAKENTDISDADKEKVEKFIEALDESDDVSDYYTNVNI